MECPVCGKRFQSSVINQHANTCLSEHSTSNTNLKSLSSVTSSSGLSKENSRPHNQQTMSCKNIDQKKRKLDSEFHTKTSDNASLENIHTPLRSIKPSNKHQQIIPFATKVSLAGCNTNNGNVSDDRSGVPSVSKAIFAPLAEQVRPQTLKDYVGQERAVGSGSLLHSLLKQDKIPSIILWGPPGCGKTTLAKIIANKCRSNGSAQFKSLSAATCGVAEVKEIIKVALNNQKMLQIKTVLFLDEIHRFNKAQQDILLPHVEEGVVTLIGATTENPSFYVNNSLLSRCRVVVLEKLSVEDIVSVLLRAVDHIGASVIPAGSDMADLSSAPESALSTLYVEQEALTLLAALVDGDARAAINGLENVARAKGHDSQSDHIVHKTANNYASSVTSPNMVTRKDIQDGLQRSHVLYDKAGEEHYNIISALHKSMRGSDDNAALYWLARMLEGGEDPLYIARRLVRFASEDVGLADPSALTQAVAAYHGSHLIGMPECDVILAQCVVYLSRAPKSVQVYQAYRNASACIRNHQGALPSVPLHLRNAPTHLMKTLGYGSDYKYNPNFTEPVDQSYFPQALTGIDFFH